VPDAVPGTLAEALAQLQGRLPRVAKEHTAKVTSQKTGNTHTYAYADLTDVSEKLLPLTSALGLSFTARPTISGDEPRFVLLYTLHHVSGDEISGEYPLPDPDRLGPQDLGKAITYARRYALCAVTGLAPGGDDDDAGGVQQEHQRQPRNVPDAQLAAGGQMTRGQKAEHERLAADTVRDPKRAERSHPRGPDPDDPWAQDAPVDPERAAALRGSLTGPELTDSEDKPGSMLDGQHRAIEMLLGKLGIPREARADRHAQVSVLLGLAEDFGSMSDLSFTQAAEAIRLLQAEVSKEKVNA